MVVFTILTVSLSAQKHIENYDPEALFNEGVLLFQNQEYGAALSVFNQYRNQAADAKSSSICLISAFEAPRIGNGMMPITLAMKIKKNS